MEFDQHDYFGIYAYKPDDPPEPYRGFSIVRERPYYLFEIKPRDGYDLPPMLSGKFTKLDTLRAQVDKFLFENPKATADTAYIEKIAKLGRGRPKKKRNIVAMPIAEKSTAE
jgi:hypothetical protein